MNPADISQLTYNHCRNKELLDRLLNKDGKNLKVISVAKFINAITFGNPEDLKARELTSEAWNSVGRLLYLGL